MGILSRFTYLMKANINHIIDRSKKPEKAIKSTLREITLDLGTLKSEANAMKVDEIRAKRELDACISDISKMERFSEKAKENAEDLKAQSFLDQKQELESKKRELTARYNKLAIEAKQMKLLEEKLALDVAQLEKRSAVLKEKSSTLESQSKLNESSVASTQAMFDDYEAELTYKLDEANALAEIRSNSNTAAISIDEEIAALEANQKRDNN
ncbi:PspA/IM30 family protein [Oceanobacillus sp. FSL H7-0719]|uniref:PspA/IM30 family protein n=1 Tax=Oceanobacillus sp. FSL H7-0719 TaxID=2954507 RepID=UPI0032568E62